MSDLDPVEPMDLDESDTDMTDVPGPSVSVELTFTEDQQPMHTQDFPLLMNLF